MTVETIKAGNWIFTEGGVPEYSIYKLLEGKVSIHKSGREIRVVEIKKGDKPISLGITAVLRDDRMHAASVRAESDVTVDRIFIDQVRGILKNEVPKDIRYDITVMIETIVKGNEITSAINEFYDLPRVDTEISENLGPEVVEILSEIKRLYTLIRADVERLCQN